MAVDTGNRGDVTTISAPNPIETPADPDDGSVTVPRTCPLCEATCGLEITLEGDAVKRIRGDREDVFSHGFICPKGSTLKQLHEDPDWLRAPVVKDGDGWKEVTWDEAFAAIEEGRSEVALLLLDRGADPALRSPLEGMTPLEAARAAGLDRVVTRLR